MYHARTVACKTKLVQRTHFFPEQRVAVQEDEQMPASPSDWQVSVMSSKPLREYTYAVADFMKTDGARYLDLPKGSPPTVTMTIKDTEDKVRS